MSQKKRLKKKPSKKVTKRKPAKKTTPKKKAVKPTRKKVTMISIPPIKKPVTPMYKTVTMIPPGRLRLWLQSNVELINITGWERKANMARTTIRQISSGKRNLNRSQLGIINKTILPELKIIVEILSNYEKEMQWLSGDTSVN